MPRKEQRLPGKDKPVRYWMESSNIEYCPICGAVPILVPYGGHSLSRIWNRVGPGEGLVCCPNDCKEGELPRPRRICREELVIVNEGETEEEA